MNEEGYQPDVGGEGERMPEAFPSQRKDLRSVDIKKKVEFVGNKNIKRELASLRNEVFDFNNAGEKAKQFEALLVAMDDSVRNNLDAAIEKKTALDTDLGDSFIRQNDWSRDVWFGFFNRQEQMFLPIVDNSGYLSWEIEVVKVLIDKLLGVIDGAKGQYHDKELTKYIKELRDNEQKNEQVRREEERKQFKQNLDNIVAHYDKLMSEQRDFYENRIYHLMKGSGTEIAPPPRPTFSSTPMSDTQAIKTGVNASTIPEEAIQFPEGMDEDIMNSIRKKYKTDKTGSTRSGICLSLRAKYKDNITFSRIDELVKTGELKEEELGNKASKNRIYLPENFPEVKKSEENASP